MSFRHDLSAALRATVRSPLSSIPAVVTLAVGTSGTIALITLLSALVLRPLPVDRPGELVSVTARDPRGQQMGFPVPFLPELAALSDVFDSAGLALISSVATAEVPGAWTPVALDSVSADYFGTLRLAPMAGRLIDASDGADAAGAARVVVLGHGFWQRHFGGDPGVIGRDIRIENVPFQVIGVTPPSYFGLRVEVSTDLTIPLAAFPQVVGLTLAPDQMMVGTAAVARLGRGVTRAQAAERVATLWPAMVRVALPPGMDRARQDRFLNGSAEVEDLSTGFSYLRERYTRLLTAVLVLCGWMLVVACVMVAGLLMARAAAMDRDRATRVALGASRMALARGVLLESLVLSCAGVLAGLPIALWGAPRLLQLLSTNFWIPATIDLAPDWRVMAATALAGAVIGLLVGMLAAWRASTLAIDPLLRTARMSAGTAGVWRWSHRLLVAQTALSVVLIVGAVALRSHLRSIRDVDPGFVSEGVTRVSLWPEPGAPQATIDDYRALQEDIAGLPHVESAAFINGDIAYGAEVSPGFPVEPLHDGRPGDELMVYVDVVSPGFLQTLSVPLTVGRDFTWEDVQGRPPVALVTASLAARLFPGGPALGQRIRLRATREPLDLEIVGILPDARLRDVRQAAPLHMLVAQAQIGLAREPRMLVKLKPGVTAAGTSVSDLVRRRGRHYVVQEQSLDAQIDHQLARERLLTAFAGFFGIFAATLVVVGLYALLSFIVTTRTAEIGVRMAIGASPGRVRGMIVWQSLRVVLAGALLGLPAALAASRWLSWMMPAIAPEVPVIAILVLLILLALGLTGAWIPARRASRVDPMTALRAE